MSHLIYLLTLLAPLSGGSSSAASQLKFRVVDSIQAEKSVLKRISNPNTKLEQSTKEKRATDAAMELLLAQPDAADQFALVYEENNIYAKLFALYGLHQVNDPRVNTLALAIKTLHYHWVGKTKGKYVQTRIFQMTF